MSDFVKPLFDGFLCTFPDFGCRFPVSDLDDFDFFPCRDCSDFISEEEYLLLTLE